MRNQLENMINELNSQHRLEIDIDSIAEIYGEDIVESMEEAVDDVRRNIEYLIQLGFGESVSDICTRYGIILLNDCDDFKNGVDKLISSIGTDFVDIMGEDMSYWETMI